MPVGLSSIRAVKGPKVGKSGKINFWYPEGEFGNNT
jgi:hypothetical protein